jgi:hypothetical protein
MLQPFPYFELFVNAIASSKVFTCTQNNTGPICIYTYVYIIVYTYVYIYVYIILYTYVYIYIYINMHVNTFIYIHIYI